MFTNMVIMRQTYFAADGKENTKKKQHVINKNASFFPVQELVLANTEPIEGAFTCMKS